MICRGTDVPLSQQRALPLREIEHKTDGFIICALTGKMIIRAGHNFVHETTANLSWHVQNFNLIWPWEAKLEQKKKVFMISIMSWSLPPNLYYKATGYASTTTDESTILLPTKMRLVLDVWWYHPLSTLYHLKTSVRRSPLPMPLAKPMSFKQKPLITQ